jgi:sodium/bile acid cotransporter 7
MIKELSKKIHGRYIVITITALMIVIGCEYLMTDDQKRQKIKEMYAIYKQKFPEVQDIDPRQAMQLSESQKIVFIDVREAEEQQVSMLPGAITEKAFLANTVKYKDHIKIGYCTISYRSGLLAQKLKAQGISMYNLKGGLLAWVHDDGKVYNEKGETNRIHTFGREWNLGPKSYDAILQNP